MAGTGSTHVVGIDGTRITLDGAPFPFTGGQIAKVVVDVSGTPYIDRERELALAFAKD